MEKLGPGDPQAIGGYRLLARLGAGGMGNVYLARSDRGRTVAVKLVRPELAAREEFRARFRQEVRSAQRVGGFWTAPVLDADTEAAVPWVAIGYVAGPSLQQVVGQDHGPLPERSVRILAAGLAHALINIHAAGIVHRDLKPSNVMITIEGPRVIDFGVARALETVTGDGGLTQTGAMVGSPGFMAPEQVRGDRITPACDVFSLGSVLAYAATGVLPFGAASSGVHALMFHIAEEEPDLTGVPEGIADLVRTCLRKDPAARPSLDQVLDVTGAHDTVSDGRSHDPWLPSALVARLGRHAVRLLEVEDPQGAGAEAGAGHLGPGLAPGPVGPGLGKRPAPVPEVAPEHSGPRGDASASHHVGPPDAAASADHRPTLVAGPGGFPPQTPPPGVASPDASPAHPAYGHSQQHPASGASAPSAYGYPQPPSGAWSATPGAPAAYNPYADGPPSSPYGLPPAAGPAAPYAPGDPGEPRPGDRRSRRTTVLLIAVALVVALAAGGSVYAFMNGDGSAEAHPTPTTAAATTPEPSPTVSAASPSASASPSSSATDGVVPAAYLGAWTATIDNASGANTRRLTISQGEVGDPVLALVADGDTYHCEFTAKLARRPGGTGPLEVGPSTVTSGEPLSSCTPGAATEVTLLSDGRLQRVNSGTGEKLTYSRG